MISFKVLDYLIITGFFIVLISLGFYAARYKSAESDDFLLSGRKVGLFLFVLTNVATWYGGILGVGEFSYRYGLISWVTQGLPYYVFALAFAFLLADKIRSANLHTIPDKLSEVYGDKVGTASSILIFILVSPAPYLLMLAQILALIFNIDYVFALLISATASSIYLIKGGYRSNIWADAFSFFIMFGGFIAIVATAISDFGGMEFLEENLPANHLTLSGGMSAIFIIVWFLIALWTFTDPGFHQRCYSAKSGKVAKWGIVISIFLWFCFDFLTNTTGIYSRAIISDLDQPVLAFPILADEIMGPGLKGLFFAALIATVISTLNSFIFLSATTFGKDFVFKLTQIENFKFSKFLKSKKKTDSENLVRYTITGIFITLILSIVIAYFFSSVVELWYLIGSICIPGLIMLVISAYYPSLKVNKVFAFYEIVAGFSASLLWAVFRRFLQTDSPFYVLEPMILGLIVAVSVHLIGIYKYKSSAPIKSK